MKTKKRFSLTIIALSGLLVFTSCDMLGGGKIDKSTANRQVLEAVNKMATVGIHSFELDLEADLDLEGEMKNLVEETETTISLDTDTSLEVKVSHLLESTAKASVELTTNTKLALNMPQPEKEDLVIEEEVEAKVAAYLNEGWLYADLTDVLDLIFKVMGGPPVEPFSDDPMARLLEGDPDEGDGEGLPTKLKYEVGDLSEVLGMEGGLALPSQPLDVDEILPYLSDLRNVSVKKDKGGISVVYEVEMDDLADILQRIFGAPTDGGPVDDDIDDGDTGEDTNVDTLPFDLSEMVEIRKAKLEVGVGSDGFLNKVYIDVDVDVDVVEEEETQDITLKGGIHLDIANINKTVSVSFPDDLDDYYELPKGLFDEAEQK